MKIPDCRVEEIATQLLAGLQQEPTTTQPAAAAAAAAAAGSGSAKKIVRSPPTALEFYRLGLVLSKLESAAAAAANDGNALLSQQYQVVKKSYQTLVASLPDDFLKRVFRDLHIALRQTLLPFKLQSTTHDEDSSYQEQVACAVQSLLGLYQNDDPTVQRTLMTTTAASASTISESLESIPALAQVAATFLDKTAKRQQEQIENNNSHPLTASILNLVRILLLRRTTTTTTRSNETSSPVIDLEHILPAIHALQEHSVVWQELIRLHPQIKSELLNMYGAQQDGQPNVDVTQQNYLANLLESDAWDSDATQKQQQLLLQSSVRNVANKPDSNKSSASPSSTTLAQRPQDEIQRRINEVRSVLPDLGEGFVEVALSHFKGHVEQTVEALLSAESLPEALRLLDRSLPRRRVDVLSSTLLQQEQEREARQTTKKVLKEQLQQEERKAAAIARVMVVASEYNDDYDDQYDEMDRLGGADTGLYDASNDFDDVRTYNQAVKQVVSEESFWEENKNTNRRPQQQQKRTGRGKPKDSGDNGDKYVDNNDDDDDDNDDNNKNDGEDGTLGEKKYRGPDKIRGGRIPGRGGGRGRGGRGGGGGDGAVAVAAVTGGRGVQGRGGGRGTTDDKTNGEGAKGTQSKSGSSNDSNSNNNSNSADARPNPRSKARALAQRREQQKKAQVKRTGA